MRIPLILLVVLFTLISVGSRSASKPEIVNIRQRPDSVGLYEKFEISLELKCEFTNPFDPDDIDIQAIFTSPSGKKKTICGFYSYSRAALWRIRFSPDETGKWDYSVTVRDRNGVASREGRSFTAVKSSAKGPLQIAGNKRYLKYGDGSDFYGVGLWYNDGYDGFGTGHIDPAELDQLKSLGVNFISTFITPLETMGSGLGRYDQNICGRLDKDGKYRLRIFHTWRGEFIDDHEINCADGKVEFGVPYMHNTDSHAKYIGQDLAFILEPVSGPAPAPSPVKTKSKVLVKKP